MNENFTTTELLIQYLDGDLDEVQSAEIKSNIEQDPLVRQEFENLRIAAGAVKEYGLKKQVALIHKEMMQELKEPAPAPAGIVRKMVQYGLRIAAIAIFVAGALICYQYFSATTEKLFSENFSGFKIHETRGSEAAPLKSAYQKGDMQEVMSQFKLLQQPNAEAYFLEGNALLNSKQPAEAIGAFIALQQKNNFDNTHYYEEDGEYFLAMSYLANNEPAKALPLFEKINADVHHPYHNHVSYWWLRKLHHVNSK